MKSDDADVIEDEATEREIRRIRQKRGKQMSETITRETRTVQRWNCPDCMEGVLWQSPMTKAERIYHHYRIGHREGGGLIAPQPAPDAGEEWRIASESSREDGEATIKAGMEWIGQVKRKHAARIISDHNAIPKLVAALEMLTCRGCENRIGWNVPFTLGHPTRSDWSKCSSCRVARAALALVKGRE